MIKSVFGFFSGMSMTFPVGPVHITLSPGLASHKKFEQTPFFESSSFPVSGSTYTARRTQSVVVVPYISNEIKTYITVVLFKIVTFMSSPYRVEAMEYNLFVNGFPFLGFVPSYKMTRLTQIFWTIINKFL